MKDEIKNCKKCQKAYSLLETRTDLCADCVEKYPYFLSFIEEFFVGGVTDKTFGRVEVYSNKGEEEYTIDELRFRFRDTQSGNSKKGKKFRKFRKDWDFKNVSEKNLEKVKKILKDEFYERDL